MNYMVSINCITYNHEKYIAQAIESFLMQKTDFDFEILIHDDASNDNTQKIIKKYETEYPDIIKVIYQTENQYSKGTKVSQLNLERATGKYIAICEGDDYWFSPDKLQKQVDYMEKNPQCSVCVHGGYLMDSSKEDKLTEYRAAFQDKIFTTEEVIKGGGALFLTNSILYRAKYKNENPLFAKNSPVGDYPLIINLSLLGEVYYLNEFMSVYRRNVEGSWSSRTFAELPNIIVHYNKMLVMLDELNVYTNGKYKNVIEQTKKDQYLPIYLAEKKLNNLPNSELRKLYNKLSFKRKIILALNQFNPSIVENIKKILRRHKLWA